MVRVRVSVVWNGVTYRRFCGYAESWQPQVSGRDAVVAHVGWFLGAVENFRFYDIKIYASTDPNEAIAEVKAEALIRPTGRIYQQQYVVFLRAAAGKIAFMREYFDPVSAAKALDTPILGLDS